MPRNLINNIDSLLLPQLIICGTPHFTVSIIDTLSDMSTEWILL